MKKSVKRILSLVLAVVMVCSLCVCAFAEEDTQANADIVFFGDSVTQAWGPDDFYFCQMVADELGIENSVYVSGTSKGITVAEDGRTSDILAASRVIFGNSGVRTHEALLALDAAEYNPDDTYYSAVSGEATIMAKEAVKNSESYIKAVKSAKTIVLETGADDVLYYAQMQSDLLGALGNIGSMSVSDIAGVLKYYGECLKEGFDNFCNDFPALVERVIELKTEENQVMGEDYQIVVVGAYNPVNGLTISNEMVAPVGDLISAITASMNVKFRQWQDEYSFCYADITNVETGAMTGVNNSFLDFATVSVYDSCMATHPSHPEGYAYIARQVLAALPENAAPADTNIRIDLGSVKSVSKVVLGNVVLSSKNYSFDPDTRVLTVKNSLPVSTLCTVTSVGEDGRIYVATYQASYSSDKGYTPYLIYSNVDIAKTFTTMGNNAVNVGKAAVTSIKGLFAK